MAKVSTTTLSESAGCRVEVGHAHFLIVSRAATVATRGKEKEVGKGERVKLKVRKAKTMPNVNGTSLQHSKPTTLLKKKATRHQLCGSGLDTEKASTSRQRFADDSLQNMPAVGTNQDGKYNESLPSPETAPPQ